MIDALVLAGGDGSRLLASGVTTPKALVAVGGRPQLVRMVNACRRVGARSVTCVVREDLANAARAALGDDDATVIPVRTPTSLHTLVAGLRHLPDGVVLCTMVDTVMPAGEWDRMHAAAMELMADADAVVAVTGYVADESPLWTDVGPDHSVRAFGRAGEQALVTGGVYWFGDAARGEAIRAVADGVQQMRGFLTRLVERQRVMAVKVPKIIDLDTGDDLGAALELVGGESQ